MYKKTHSVGSRMSSNLSVNYLIINLLDYVKVSI